MAPGHDDEPPVELQVGVVVHVADEEHVGRKVGERRLAQQRLVSAGIELALDAVVEHEQPQVGVDGPALAGQGIGAGRQRGVPAQPADGDALAGDLAYAGSDGAALGEQLEPP